MTVTRDIDFEELWQAAIPYQQFASLAERNKSLWEGVYRTAKIPQWAVIQACAQGRGRRLLAIVEDWCGDASNTIPLLARLGDEADCLEMRVIRRDEHPEVMDRYLTNGTRSIPIVIVLDEDFRELGSWGPRPSQLQAWVVENKGVMPKQELYPRVRQWYARDRGATTLREVLELSGAETEN